MEGGIVRELEALLGEACASPCISRFCNDLLYLLAVVRKGGLEGRAAASRLARMIDDLADYAEAAGCADEAGLLNRASLAAHALRRLVG